ncbi:tRNA wybutosine-synthesizing protein [Drepanopeziza brunnea f. sp. 'multigermtubi' MB_m1]|uniref:tRNA wybutosine-synthesizing protein 2 n=2 Tax=Drepanopeziza brunnea f. sp. 'multigermtubi' TaxID=698441 RepID=K1X3B4_MARBU|nr:tRNA wybutosine-synthesizing protein [Drepanopeziza brunnea f. sp. 'multigermtubi' MB_m1]EKD15178.1 tRNA wybutosine-synthesizing protein [Drepanopeziza brunnea f. sp. 'multigermtubi' MB_m1]
MTISNICMPHVSSTLKRPPKPKPANPIETAVKSWLASFPLGSLESFELDAEILLSSIPKRWVVYAPMVLLPAGSFGPEWWEIIRLEVMSSKADELWKLMLQNIEKREGKGILTHLAINSGIPLHKTTTGSEPDQRTPSTSEPADAENILRTPSGLVMLYGDFGPRSSPDLEPAEKDFEDAFWVSTKQNGITQVWAPRYTMFSRGNVKEKARLLDFHSPKSGANSLRREQLKSATAVDLYAGIGYFVFSYAKMGMKRVVGWELNPWSVEGLRRGAVANGWSVKVVKDGTDFGAFDEQIVMFLEDNSMAADRIQKSRALDLDNIRHVNCGLLPTSEPVWDKTLRILRGDDGWLHLHENVGVSDIQTRRREIEEKFASWIMSGNDGRVAKVEHVELVKTFAPGVWHCVFDVHITQADHPPSA